MMDRDDAQRSFELLGFEQKFVDMEDGTAIMQYVRTDPYGDAEVIAFDNGELFAYTIWEDEHVPIWMNGETIRAVYKQAQELGWIEEEQ